MKKAFVLVGVLTGVSFLLTLLTFLGVIESTMFWIAVGAIVLLQYISLFFTGYNNIVTLISLFFPDRKSKSNFELTHNRFAILVCAHNEEAVIGQIVQNLNGLDYPKNSYDIHVIADNCSDTTALVARDAGAHAWERQDMTQKGKGYGLEWMFSNLWNLEKQGDRYDAVLVLDADNLVSKNFLQVLNAKLLDGHEAIQAYLDSKNPKDTWITKSYAVAYWITNEVFQKARYKIGLSAQLGGTGMCFTTKILKELGWGATSLTEDLEFTARYIQQTGKGVAWAHEARLYDEKPLGFKQSWTQRIRWMQGHANCMIGYSPKLLWNGLKGNMKALDMALYLLQPGRVMLSLISMIYFAILYAGHIPEKMTQYTLTNPYWNITILVYFTLPFVGLILSKKVKHVLWVFIAWIFGLSWLPVIFLGLVKRNQKEWSHTKHNRTMNADELQTIHLGM